MAHPPRFRFWKEWGAGKRRRIPYFKHWWNSWKHFEMKEWPDHTINPSLLPANARIFNAQELMKLPVALMPDTIIQRKEDPVVYSYPWPFNVEQEVKLQPAYHYSNSTIFFKPLVDPQVLTNTILEQSKLRARTKVKVSDQELALINNNYRWIMRDDSCLSRLPLRMQFPFFNRRPVRDVGRPREQKETHMLNMLNDVSQTLASKYYNEVEDDDSISRLLDKRSIPFPNCQVPINRDDLLIHLDLTVENLTISSKPLGVVNKSPEKTEDIELVSIKPRSWKSLMEQSCDYDTDTTFTVPPGSYPNLVQLAARINRTYKSNELMARLMVHLHGVGLQFARQNTFDKPLVLNGCAFDAQKENFHFMKYQLNTLDYSGIKNQAWYSGSIKSIDKALKYYLSFHTEITTEEEPEVD